LCVEDLLDDLGVKVWAYNRDQRGDERTIAGSLKRRVKKSSAAIVLISQYTLAQGATQWMELSYADAFKVPTFILLHHMTFDELKKSDKSVPPLVLQGHCTPALRWRSLEGDLRRHCRHRGGKVKKRQKARKRRRIE
jgi:hypothetical protein